MKKESLVAEIMNYIVSGYVYFVALTLVLYMVTSLISGFFATATGLLDISSSIKTILSAPERAAYELSLLHTIAFTIVLVKAYKILIAYAQTRHINIKYLIEISIIAPIIEIIFNSRTYALEVIAVFGLFAFFNMVAYLFFYKTIKEVSKDYDKMCTESEQ
jgi:uncharacterized membrane protein (DUF373 family)